MFKINLQILQYILTGVFLSFTKTHLISLFYLENLLTSNTLRVVIPNINFVFMSSVKDDGEHLIQFLNSLYPLSKKIVSIARKETYHVFVKKNEVISCANSDEGDCVFIILKGLFRGFIIDEGKDITTLITDENHIVGHVRNPNTLKPIYEEKFQALEDSELLVLRYSFIDDLYVKYPEMNILARKLLAFHFHLSQERGILSRIPSAEARYNQFRAGNPTLKNRVPIKFLATYLGMRIETLSRIRKKEKLGSAA